MFELLETIFGIADRPALAISTIAAASIGFAVYFIFF